MKRPLLKIERADIGSIFDCPFSYEDPRLPDLFWDEMAAGNVIPLKIDLPEHDLPEYALFSGRTPGHQRLCAQVAAWLLKKGRGYSAENNKLGYPGGIADVTSADQTLFAECGYTNVGKILRGLHGELEMVVASYSFEPLLFRRVGVMRFETYLKDLEEGAQRAVEKMTIALRYEDRGKKL